MSRGMRIGVWVLAIAVCLSIADPASACMFGRRGSVQRTSNYYAPTACASCGVPAPVAVAVPAPVVAQYAAPAPVVAQYFAPQPVQVQETRMVQRCYLAPVTTMQPQTQLENVTTLRTEFFDEAHTTMQTSAYYDPCGCGYKAVTTPVTSVVRRSRVVPVTQTVTRNYFVPVTTYEQRFTMEPVTETKLYYPPAVAVAAPAMAVQANYVAPVPVAGVVAPAPVANYVAPAPAVANYAVPGQALAAAPQAPPAIANYAVPSPPTATAMPPALPGLSRPNACGARSACPTRHADPTASDVSEPGSSPSAATVSPSNG